MANKNSRPWPLWVRILSTAVVVFASGIAVASLAKVLGWLTGASMTPVVPVIIPLVFALLAAVGLGHKAVRPFGKVGSMWEVTFVSFLVIIFCNVYFYSVTLGTFEKAGQYRHMQNLLGEAWDKTDDDTLAMLYRLRLRARQVKLPPPDFESVVRQVVKPILIDDQPNKPERVAKALAIVESGLSPAPNEVSAAQPSSTPPQKPNEPSPIVTPTNPPPIKETSPPAPTPAKS